MSATRRPASERLVPLVVVALFSHGLGIGIVAVPLLALEAGYDEPSVGFLVAVASLSQLIGRLFLPWLLGRFPDRSLIAFGSLCLIGAYGSIALSTALPVFLVAQILQGTARSLFWTSSQTHVIRAPGRSVDRLVDLNLAGNAGTLTGPLVAGILGAIDLRLALAAAVIVASGATIASLGLQALPPFDRRQSSGTRALLGRPGIGMASWAAFASGGWWSMLGSYIPVLLVGAGLGTFGVGGLVTIAEAAGLLALVAVRGLPTGRVADAVRWSGIVVCAALIGLAVAPALLVLHIPLLIAGGAACGMATTLAPALASAVAGPEEQGDALALSGTFRAGALLSAPAGVGALVSIVPLAGALALLGIAMAGAGVAVGWRVRASNEQP